MLKPTTGAVTLSRRWSFCCARTAIMRHPRAIMNDPAAIQTIELGHGVGPLMMRISSTPSTGRLRSWSTRPGTVRSERPRGARAC